MRSSLAAREVGGRTHCSCGSGDRSAKLRHFGNRIYHTMQTNRLSAANTQDALLTAVLSPWFIAGLLSWVMVAYSRGPAFGQNYPTKPVRIVASGIGGSGDFVARLIAPAMAANMGQQVIVDNRASGVIPGQVVAEARPDGYTLLIAGAALWLGPFMRKTPYDPIKDFLPVTITNMQPNVLVVNPSISVNSVKDLISSAKARPAELNYATTGAGSSSHLAAELFNAMAGVKIVRVNYKSTATMMGDLMGNQVQLNFGVAGAVTPQVKSGRLKALAVTSIAPSPLFPELPTVAATVPGYEAVAILGIFVPARTSDALIDRLNREIVRVIQQPETRETLLGAGIEPVGSLPRELAARVKSEMSRFGKVITDAGIRAD